MNVKRTTRVTAAVLSTLLSLGLIAASSETSADEGNLPAKMEIARLPVTYAWAVDAKDVDLMMTIFSENAVYDLSVYGFPPVVGKENIRAMFLWGVFPFEESSFSSISNIRVNITGNTASGADYFLHYGYNPIDADPTWAATRTHTEGQHFYGFVKEGGAWKKGRDRPISNQNLPVRQPSRMIQGQRDGIIL